MAEYSELIKRFDKIRDYMRDFYVYGFKSRESYDKKSLRTYDNEKRRIESYLGDFMSFRQDENGKTVFISLDGALVSQNPLYRAFKAKTFTKNDISLHFILLDILRQRDNLSAVEIADIVVDEYLSFFDNAVVLDVSTVRNKLNEYEKLGLILSQKQGKKLLYSLKHLQVDLEQYYNALLYFSEVSLLGVVGSFLLDKINRDNPFISFKHHYITHVLDSEIAFEVLEGITQKRSIQISSFNPRSQREYKAIIIPVKMLVSVSNARQYICGFDVSKKIFSNFRIDYIKEVTLLDECDDFDAKRAEFEQILKHTWGISFGNAVELETVEMILQIAESEKYIINRINREGRGGSLTKISENKYKYEVAVFDAREMIPWLRTFIGRIVSFKCSNKYTQKIFYNDLEQLYKIYGGESDDI